MVAGKAGKVQGARWVGVGCGGLCDGSIDRLGRLPRLSCLSVKICIEPRPLRDHVNAYTKYIRLIRVQDVHALYF